MATNLITLEEYAAFKGLTANFSEKESLEISALIASASNTIEEYCNRKFQDYINTPYVQMDNGDANTIYLRHFPVLEVQSVEYSSDLGLTYETLTENDDYVFLEEEDAIITVSGLQFSNPPVPRAVKISYTAGYTEIPSDLKHVTYLICEHYKNHEYTPRKELGADSLQFAGFSFMDKDFPAQIKRILDLYRDITSPDIFY